MRKQRLALNTISSLIFQICTIICGFILPWLILNSFGSEVNGLVNSISQFLGIISFLELGVGAVMQSSLYKPLAEKDNALMSKIMVSGQKFFSKLALILLVYVIVLMAGYPFVVNKSFGFIYTATMVGIISISMFAQYYFGIVNSLLLTSDQRGYITYNVQTLTLILNTAACFVLIKLGASIHLVKLTTSLVYLMRPLYLVFYVKKHYQLDRKIKYEGEPIKQKWNGVAQHVSAVVLGGTDSIVLTLFSTLSAVSIYSIYNIVINGVKQLLISMTNGIQAVMGELWAKQELVKLREVFGWTEWVIHTGTTYIFGVTAILIVPFVQVYTKNITDANYIQPLFAVLLVAANAGHCLRLPYNIMILAGGHYKQTQSNYIIAAVMNIVISVVLVYKLGLVGVAIGTLAAMLYQTFWMAVYDSRNLIKWPFKNFIKQFIVDIITAMIMFFVNMVFDMSAVSYIAWLVLALKVSICSLFIVLIINYIIYRTYVNKVANTIVRLIKKS